MTIEGVHIGRPVALFVFVLMFVIPISIGCSNSGQEITRKLTPQPTARAAVEPPPTSAADLPGPPINRDRLVDTFMDLVRISSPSGKEDTIARELASRLRRLGLDVSEDNYGNIIATDGGPNPILLSTHMDTVAPGIGIKPLIEGDRIVSDGSTILGGDAKAGIAAILEAVESVVERGTPHRGFEVVFTREEETGLVGARNLDFSKVTAREGIVLDGEGPVSKITSGSPNGFGFRIEVTGRAAHAGIDPENGVSAIKIASEVVSRLPQGRLDDETTLNIGLIEGGTVTNAVPDQAVIRGEFRAHDSRRATEMRSLISDVANEVEEMFPESTVTASVRAGMPGYRLSEENPMLGKVTTALQSIGLEPEMKLSGAGTDANVFRQLTMDVIVVGMGDYNLHSEDEYVSIPELIDAARLVMALLVDE